MLTYPNIDPVILAIGPLKIRWYGLMYVLGFLASYLLVSYQIKKDKYDELAIHFENLNTILIISLILGGRLGYVFFYNFSYYIKHPLEIMATWQGGMSFHGAVIGLIASGFIFCKIKKLNFWKAADIYVVTIPIGLGLGRLGNFINGELFGRISDVSWAMKFPHGGPLPRHPSQIYEFLLEGVALFFILWTLKNKKLPYGFMVGFFLVFYGIFRVFVEQFREPDTQLGFIIYNITMGQILSSLMIIGGLAIFICRRKKYRNS